MAPFHVYLIERKGYVSVMTVFPHGRPSSSLIDAPAGTHAPRNCRPAPVPCWQFPPSACAARWRARPVRIIGWIVQPSNRKDARP